MSFRLFTSGTDLDPFMVEANPNEFAENRHDHREDALSNLLWERGQSVSSLRKLLPLKPLAWIRQSLELTKDSFTLTIDYSASQDIGPLLLKALGTALVTVD